MRDWPLVFGYGLLLTLELVWFAAIAFLVACWAHDRNSGLAR